MAPSAKLDLIDSIDALDGVRRLMRGAWMAADSLGEGDAAPIQAVLDAADSKMQEVKAALTAQVKVA